MAYDLPQYQTLEINILGVWEGSNCNAIIRVIVLFRWLGTQCLRLSYIESKRATYLVKVNYFKMQNLSSPLTSYASQ